jgi:hypothetical protein
MFNITNYLDWRLVESLGAHCMKTQKPYYRSPSPKGCVENFEENNMD